jgi:hypothetical protein
MVYRNFHPIRLDSKCRSRSQVHDRCLPHSSRVLVLVYRRCSLISTEFSSTTRTSLSHPRSLLPFIIQSLTDHNTMFKSVFTLTLTLLSLTVTLTSAAPMPMNVLMKRAGDGGSAYSGVGGEANGGSITKYNRSVLPLFFHLTPNMLDRD